MLGRNPEIGGALAEVVGLGASCELDGETTRELRLRVGEFALMSDGAELVLHKDRGLTISASPGASLSASDIAADLESAVRAAVLGDDAEETGEEHPWDWLVDLLASHRVIVTREQLRALPYEVRLSEDVRARIDR